MDVRNPIDQSASKASRREVVSRRHIPLMATPPTLALSTADAASSISGATRRAPKGLGTASAPIDFAGDPFFTYAGTPSMAAGTSSNAAFAFTPTLTGATTSRRYNANVRFRFYGDRFEIVFKALTATWWYRVRVDGQWASYETQYLSGLTVGSIYRVLVTLPTVGPRHVQIDFNGAAFAGIDAAPTHAITRPLDYADTPTIALGDSITAGANPGSSAGSVSGDTWLNYTAELLGWRDVRNVALAGTGYAVSGAEGAAFKDRLADLSVPGARYVVYGGLNDAAGSAFDSAVDTVFAQIRSMAPAEFYVLGRHPANGDAYASSTAQSINATLQAKAAIYGAAFIDALAQSVGAPRWVTGNGNASSPNGSGSADVFVNGDNLHPTRAGHQHLGLVRADQLIATMPR